MVRGSIRCMSAVAGGWLALHASVALGQQSYEGCSTATDLGDLSLGTLSLPYVLSGDLESTPGTADVDYYRVTGAPPGAQLVVTVRDRSLPTGSPSLVGVFDSACELMALTEQGPPLIVTVPADGVLLLAVTEVPDYDFLGGGVGPYEIEIGLSEPIGSISGLLLDFFLGVPIDYALSPEVVLSRCQDDACISTRAVSSTEPDWWSGAFSFSMDWYGAPLEPGRYVVTLSARDYQSQMSAFDVAAGQDLDLGRFYLVGEPPIGSIRGAIVDRDTGEPLQGDVYLYQCFSLDCAYRNEVNRVWTDGRFSFDQDYNTTPLPAGVYQIDFVEPWEPRHLPFSTAPFSVAANEDLDLGELAVASLPVIGSIAGRVVDATTRAPLPGTSEPFALVVFESCGPYGCSWGEAYPDASGRFRADRDMAGQPIFLGDLHITVYASQYVFTQLEVSDLTQREHRDLGDIALQSNPIRFSDLQPCANVPSSGGHCQFSVGVTNGQTRALSATLWAKIDAWGLNSVIGSSSFSLGAHGIGFGPGTLGAKKIVTFDLTVPAEVQDSARFCARVYAGDGASNPFLEPIGESTSFCVMKDPAAAAYRVLPKGEASRLLKGSLQSIDSRPRTHLLHERARSRSSRQR
ncbi:MAG: hypothetical protein IT384_03820 [Deltaproteobacteria bacterium]|nr:hypothetical protein [Deltaproteobacteria bacterium]